MLCAQLCAANSTQRCAGAARALCDAGLAVDCLHLFLGVVGTFKLGGQR
jgi:hypothetical protein